MQATSKLDMLRETSKLEADRVFKMICKLFYSQLKKITNHVKSYHRFSHDSLLDEPTDRLTTHDNKQ